MNRRGFVRRLGELAVAAALGHPLVRALERTIAIPVPVRTRA